jgi:phosphomethylpyrimidine synthase
MNMDKEKPYMESTNVTQIHKARRSVTTEQMKFVAEREKLEPEVIRAEVARGRMVIPANVNHRNLEPMCIGIAAKCKVNANIGNSSTTSNVEEELGKLRYCIKYGADTVMDLSTGGDIPRIRKAIIDGSPVPIGTVPIYEALSRVRRVEDLSAALMHRSNRGAGTAGRGLHDNSRGRFGPAHSLDSKPHNWNRKPRRLHSGGMDGQES